MATMTLEQALDLGLRNHQAGRLSDAEQIYRRILAQQPNHPDALHLLGTVAIQAGRYEIAADLIGRAIAIRPDWAEAISDRGQALRLQGEIDQAITAFRRAIVLKPSNPKSHNNLGIALAEAGRLDEAVIAFEHALSLRPNLAEAWSNLGNVLKSKERSDEAVAAYSRAIALKPSYSEAHYNLGNALYGKRLFHRAIASYQQAIALNPNYPEAFSNLGMTFKENGQPAEAVAACSRAIALRPRYPEAYYNLANALYDLRHLDRSIAAHRQAIALRSDFPEAFGNLGNVLKDNGQLDDAIAAYRQAIALKPDNAHAHSNLVYITLFHPGYDSRMIAEEHRRWNLEHAEPLRKCIVRHLNDRDPDRRLRIGYVSPDFRDHVVGLNLLPLFRNHNRSQFEIFCYAQVATPDAITGVFRQYADRWIDTIPLSDKQLATQIREDQIDILVDLTLHMSNSRLLVFARKPAPVQVTFAGYPGSTGLTAIDYRLSDPFLEPVVSDAESQGRGDEVSDGCVSGSTERSIRLPNSFWCYDPLDCADISISALPALTSGVVTFGCLNNFCKFNEAVLALWARVIGVVKDSRLVLSVPSGVPRQRTLDQFDREGIAVNRIDFVSHQPRREYLAQYHRIDIGLDTFPYNGHTTNLDNFWMGVPVVTLVGSTPVARAGWCQLSNLGLTELAAQSPDEFVEIAGNLAKNLPRLANLRTTLRQRMQQSPLMDAPRFARNIEAAYRQMWQTWCLRRDA